MRAGAADVVEAHDAQADLARQFGIAQPVRLRAAAEDRLADTPTLLPGTERWYVGWWVLHRARDYTGMAGAPQGLRYTEMAAYARDHVMPRDPSVALWQAMDEEFRQWWQDQQPNDDPARAAADAPALPDLPPHV